MATKTKKRQPVPRHVRAKHQLREVWLHEAMTFVRQHFKDAGYDVPEHVRVGTGWPSRGGLAKKKRTIGQAWSNKCSGDGTHEIIISVYLDDPIRVLGVLIHEVIHVTVGVEHGHKKPFTDCMKAVGLDGKPTATTESAELVERMKPWADALGPYPHAKLDGLVKDTQGTRMLLMECDCGLKIRTTQKWIDTYGPRWGCPCGSDLVLQEN